MLAANGFVQLYSVDHRTEHIWLNSARNFCILGVYRIHNARSDQILRGAVHIRGNSMSDLHKLLL